MFSLNRMSSCSSKKVLSTYNKTLAAVAGSMMMPPFQHVAFFNKMPFALKREKKPFGSISSNESMPHKILSYISSIFQKKYFFMNHPTTWSTSSSSSSSLTLIMEEYLDVHSQNRNEVYEATDIFLLSKITPAVDRLILTKSPRDVKLSITFERGQEIIDVFQGIQMKWALVSSKKQENDSNEHKSCFELSFQKRHKDFVLESYMPYVLNRAKILKEENRVLKLHKLRGLFAEYDNCNWSDINLENPTTFDKLAMDPNMKKELMEDLDRFVRRGDFYKKVGKPRKRWYLLYGPPGTGKSSLIAAMANYLHFDIFHFDLEEDYDGELRKMFVAATKRSIFVIDCTSLELHDPSQEHQEHDDDVTLAISGLLNFIDGVCSSWSSCGDEKIIVLTMNHDKDRLDPDLLRQMNMQIHMSYCTFDGFKLLASNYLSIDNDHHKLFKEIEHLMEDSQITPAEVVDELMKSDDADIALGSLVKLLEQKKKNGTNKEELQTISN